MKEYWYGLQPRERKILTWGGGVLLVLFLYLGIWEPAVIKVEEHKTMIASQQETLAWMKRTAVEVKQLQRTAGGGVSRSSGESLLSLVDRTAKQAKLADNMKRVQPDGKNRVRVWLERASFDAVVGWLETIERKHRIAIDSIQVEALDAPGEVDIRLVLQEAVG